jgi:subtilisin family serine protease
MIGSAKILLLAFSCCLCGVILMPPETACAPCADAPYAAGEIIVKFVPQVGKAAVRWRDECVFLGIPSLDERLARYRVAGARPIFPYKDSELGHIYQFDFDPAFDPTEVAADFARDRHTLYAEPRYIQHLYEIPNDEFYLTGIQYYINLMRCPQAWDITHGDSLVVIAIVDTGVDWDHPDLFANIWVNPGEDVNGDGIFDDIDRNALDDDSNGYIDDWCGWDFSGNGVPDNDPVEWAPIHGTHVAGCAAAVTNNGLGVAGVGWNCSIMAVKVTKDGHEGIQYGYEGILYAAENGADVINASWGHSGGPPSQFEQEVIDSANARGAIIVSAAGNDPDVSPPDTCEIEYPAWYDHVVAVAATNRSDRATDWTFYGSWVDVAAPGQAIYNTWYDDNYTLLQGTSMSSPLVAGVAGLLKSIDPGMTSDEFEDKMWHTADDISDKNPGYIGRLGGGRANAYRAVLSMTDPDLTIQESLIDDVGGNGDGHPDPGETVNWAITLGNTPTWQPAQNLRVKVSSDSPLIAFAEDSVAFEDIAPGECGDNSGAPFQFTVAAADTSFWATFHLHMEAQGAVGNLVDSLKMLIGRAPVLIVDDDGGRNLEDSYQRGLDGMAVLYETWDVKAMGKVAEEDLMPYDVVVWLTGAEVDSTLTAEDRENLAAFLDAGHCLFLSGQNIGDEVGQSSFLRDYVHVSHLADSVSLDPAYLDGVMGDVISDGVTLMLSGSEPQDSPGGVETIDGGMTIFSYRSAPQYAAATRYESPQGYKVVYFAFGYEGISGTDTYTHGPVVLKRIMNWFQVPTGITADPDIQRVPRQARLSQNYPNPFNAETKIRYVLPNGAAHHRTTLRIYNILGQEIRVLVDAVQEAGDHTVRWDGCDQSGQAVSTGVYFYCLQSGPLSQMRKMVLLR